MQKIAFIGQKGIPAKQGGVEKHVQELSIRLVKLGFDVSVYSRPYYTSAKRKSYQGVNIISLPSLNTKHLDAITHSLFATLHAIVKGYDVIHYQGVGPSLVSFIPRIFSPKTKVITTFHCLDRQHQKWGLVSRFMLTLGEWTAVHFPHKTIVVSKILKKYCRFKFNKETIYIPNGTTPADAKTNAKILKKYNLKKDGYFFVASRLVKNKGIHTLIKAYQKMNSAKKLVIAGGSSHTDEYATYLKDISKDNKNIMLLGQKTGQDLETLFKNAYLFVQPSESEGLSIALLEAMSYNTPVLVSNISENMEVASRVGISFKNKNINDLTKQLGWADKNPNKIRAMAKLAKKRVETNYNWDDIAEDVADLYNRNIESGIRNLEFGIKNIK